jgi:hypothetical protein
LIQQTPFKTGVIKKNAGCKKKSFFLPFLPTAKTSDNFHFGILFPLSTFFFSITAHIPIEWVKQNPPSPSPCDLAVRGLALRITLNLKLIMI